MAFFKEHVAGILILGVASSVIATLVMTWVLFPLNHNPYDINAPSAVADRPSKVASAPATNSSQIITGSMQTGPSISGVGAAAAEPPVPANVSPDKLGKSATRDDLAERTTKTDQPIPRPIADPQLTGNSERKPSPQGTANTEAKQTRNPDRKPSSQDAAKLILLRMLGSPSIPAEGVALDARSLRQDLVKDPKNSISWEWLGLALGHAGDLDGAEDAFRKAITNMPRGQRVAGEYSELSAVLELKGNLKGALNASRIGMPDDERWCGSGMSKDVMRILVKLNRSKEASIYFHDLLKNNPTRGSFSRDYLSSLGIDPATADECKKIQNAFSRLSL